MSESSFKFMADDIYQAYKQMRKDIDAMKQDIEDIRADTTEIIDSQYEMDKKVSILLKKLDDRIY